MKLESDNSVLEIERCEVGPPGTPGEEDVLISVSVLVHRYSAADEAWIVGSDFKRFLQQLENLEVKRQGNAILEGASPDEFTIEFFSIDRAGHMAVKGHVGWHNTERHFQRLHFGFSFEPDKLPTLVLEFRQIARD
jgi:hypothetical protein